MSGIIVYLPGASTAGTFSIHPKIKKRAFEPFDFQPGPTLVRCPDGPQKNAQSWQLNPPSKDGLPTVWCLTLLCGLCVGSVCQVLTLPMKWSCFETSKG